MRITMSEAERLRKAANTAVLRYFDCETEEEYNTECKELFLAFCESLGITEIDMRY